MVKPYDELGQKSHPDKIISGKEIGKPMNAFGGGSVIEVKLGLFQKVLGVKFTKRKKACVVFQTS